MAGFEMDYRLFVFVCTMVLFVVLFLQIDYARHLVDKVLQTAMREAPAAAAGRHSEKRPESVQVFAVDLRGVHVDSDTSVVDVPSSSFHGSCQANEVTFQLVPNVRMFDAFEEEDEVGSKARYFSCAGRTYLYRRHDRSAGTLTAWDLSTLRAAAPGKRCPAFYAFGTVGSETDLLQRDAAVHFMVYTIS
jgi:hypothetical protein